MIERFNRRTVGTSIMIGEDARADPDHPDLSETAIVLVYQEELFTLLACEIAAFPNIQRRVLFIDLANHMSFE